MASRRFVVVEVEHSAKPPVPVNRTIIRSNSPVSVDQSVTEPPMVSFTVIVVYVFSPLRDATTPANEDHPIQAFVFDRAHGPLCIGVQVW
jgi:hypothetical protein